MITDATPPAAPPSPSLTPDDDSGAAGDGITGVTRPHLVGTAEAGTTVQILDASGNVVASGQSTTKPVGRFDANIVMADTAVTPAEWLAEKATPGSILSKVA